MSSSVLDNNNNTPDGPAVGRDLSSSDLEANSPNTEKTPVSDATSARSIHGIGWFLVIVAILSSIFLYSLDNTVVADITPAAIETLGGVLDLPWLSVGFLLGGSAAVLPLGRLYGLFDAKWLYVASSALFNVGSALCGAAPSMPALIVGRVLAGMGGNGMYLGVMTLLSVNTSDRERPKYLSFVGLVWGIGTVLGPVIGGAFAESTATWRWAFYINLVVAGLFAPVYLFLIPSFKPRAGAKATSLIREFDGVGTIISLGAIMPLIMAINFGGSMYAWNSGQIIALFVVSGVFFIIFGFQQAYSLLTSTANRIFPSHFLRNPNAVLLYICASAVNAAGFVPIYYIPLYFQFTRGDGAIDSAVRLLPLIFLLSAAILANGHVMARFSYFQPWYILGSVLALIGGVLLSRIGSDTSVASIYGFEVLVGLGTGAFIQAGYAVIQGVTAPADLAYAISFMMLAQLGGIAFGLSIAGALFINSATTGLKTAIPGLSVTDLQLLLSGTSSSYYQSLPGDLRAKVVEIIVEALAKVFIVVYVGAAVALVASVLFTKRKLFQEAMAIAA